MKFDYAVTARFMRQRLVRHYWTTTQQKWTTAAFLTGLVVATLLVPPLGIAVFGTAFAGWWLTVALMTIFFAVVGNNVGVRREKAALMRQSAVADRRRDTLS